MLRDAISYRTFVNTGPNSILPTTWLQARSFSFLLHIYQPACKLSELHVEQDISVLLKVSVCLKYQERQTGHPQTSRSPPQVSDSMVSQSVVMQIAQIRLR